MKFFLLCLLFINIYSQPLDSITIPVTYYDFHNDGSNPDFNPWKIGNYYPNECRITVTGLVDDLLHFSYPLKGNVCKYSDGIEYWFKHYDILNVKVPQYRIPDSNSLCNSYWGILRNPPNDYKTNKSLTAYKNIEIKDSLVFKHIGNNIYEYRNYMFYPINHKGFGNEGFACNGCFTMVMNWDFVYNTGMKLVFQGDDDLFLFINKRLALDLGSIAIHSDTLYLDQIKSFLSLNNNNCYPFDLFYAERQWGGSKILIQTNIIPTNLYIRKLR